MTLRDRQRNLPSFEVGGRGTNEVRRSRKLRCGRIYDPVRWGSPDTKIRSSRFRQTTIPVDRHRHLPLGRTPQGIISLPRNGSRRYQASGLVRRRRKRQQLSEPNPATPKALRKSFAKHQHPPAYARSESSRKGVIPQPFPRVRRSRRGRHSPPQHHPTRSTGSTTMVLALIVIPIFLESIDFQLPSSSSSPQEWTNRRLNSSLARMESTSLDSEKLTTSTMERSGVRV